MYFGMRFFFFNFKSYIVSLVKTGAALCNQTHYYPCSKSFDYAHYSNGVGRSKAAQRYPCLRTPEYVSLWGKRNVADVIKNHRMAWSSSWLNVLTGVLTRGEAGGAEAEEEMWWQKHRLEWCNCCLEGDQEVKHMGSLERPQSSKFSIVSYHIVFSFLFLVYVTVFGQKVYSLAGCLCLAGKPSAGSHQGRLWAATCRTTSKLAEALMQSISSINSTRPWKDLDSISLETKIY